MALHTGDAVIRGRDYFGPTVNRTARLMSLAFGEQILVSSSTASLTSDNLVKDVWLRELGSYRLKDLSLPETTFQVVAPGLRSDFPPIVDVDSLPNNLPYQTSSFVGREGEIAQLRGLLSERRILTITGMGGIGKTRLALQVASEVIEVFPQGAWLVDLSGLTDPALIEQSIAAALSIREAPQEPLLTTIVTHLRERKLLIVIDNAEHLLAGVAHAVSALTSHCARVHVVTTSREPLHVAGEYVYRLGPLSDAQSLFVERSHAISGRAADAADEDAVEALCRKLGGIPLAVELAAARTTLLSVEQLDRRLGTSFDVLASRGSENARHSTLESTIDWSYQLLDEPEKRLFESLSIFSGGFTLEACEAIGGVAGASVPILDMLQSLVEKSLVSVASNEIGPRFELLETIREFARKRRPGLDSDDDLVRAHFAFCLELILSYPLASKTQERERAASAVSADIENCRAALAWAIQNGAQQCGEFLCALAFYWQNHGNFIEGRAWLRRYLKAFDDRDPLYLRVLRFAAFFAAKQDDYDEASLLTERLLDIASARDDGLMAGEALHTLAGIDHGRGDLSSALARYEEALDLFSAAAHDRHSLIAILNIGEVLLEKLEPARCEELLERAERLALRVGEDELTALTLMLRGDLSLHLERFEEAEGYARRALVLHEGAKGGRRADSLSLIAEIQARRGQADAALDLIREGLALSLLSDELHGVIRFFEVLAYVLFVKERYEECLRYYCAASYLRQTNGYLAQQLYGAREFERELRSKTGEAFDRAARQAPLESWRALAERRV
jgi:predicted ATPase